MAIKLGSFLLTVLITAANIHTTTTQHSTSGIVQISLRVLLHIRRPFGVHQTIALDVGVFLNSGISNSKCSICSVNTATDNLVVLYFIS